MNDDDDWFEKQKKSMIRTMIPLWIAFGLISLSFLCALIAFVFWLLRHHGIIG